MTMNNIQIITNNEGVEFVIEEFAPNEFRSMRKDLWDEQQAQKELGGTL